MDFDGVVLVPGLMCDAVLFEPQRRLLAPHTKVHVADTTRASTMKDMAMSVLDEAPFERFALVGLSMGGIVAMHMLPKAEGRIARLALLDTNYLPDDDQRKRERLSLVEEAHERGLEAVVRERMKPQYLAPMRRHDPHLNGLVVGMAMRLGIDVFERQTQALISREDATPHLRRWKGRTLVLCGRHDRPCPPSRHDEIAALLPDAHRVTLPGAGHLTTLEAPKAANSALLEWLL